MSDIVVLEEEQPRKRSKVPGSGRRAGTPNKYTREMKEAMFAGAENSIHAKDPNNKMLPAR